MINSKVRALRKQMQDKGIDCYIVPSFDAHQSEYVAEHWKCRQWISGFTGSAGTVVVTMDQALLWTDGRYHVQAEKQLQGSEYHLMKQGLYGVPSISAWLSEVLTTGQCLGFDGNLMAMSTFQQFEKISAKHNLKISYKYDLITPIWNDRPAIPQTTVMDLDTAYTGKSRTEKLTEIRAEMLKQGADAYLVPNLDDICWIFNIRGNDVKYSPLVIAYALITLEQTHLFIEKSKIPSAVQKALTGDHVMLHPYRSIHDFLKILEVDKLLYAPKYTSVSLLKSLKDTVKAVDKGDIATRFKAVKNATEIENLKKCHLKDSVAMVLFHKWLMENVPKGLVNELTVAEKLRELRAAQPLNLGESFNTIAAYGANAAMMHYSATPQSYAQLQEEGYLLVDSGGQYLDGTTDITRTYTLGPLTEEQRVDYTLTLKSHIGLAQARFLRGTCGPHLDILARKPMWDHGLDYKCGTGHGVGFLLGVHEGPHTIRCNQNNVPLEKGMIITNEPGVYKQGRHGIRIENTVLVVEDQITEFGEFYKLETISFCPIDTTPLKVELMSAEEIKWLNDYHQAVYHKLSPYLNEADKKFLADLTTPLQA